MKAPPNSSKPRVNCPRGAHLSRLVQIVDLGSQHFKPGDDASRKIYFGFETCNARHVFKDENGPEPFMLQIEFAFYMTSANPSKPTKLRQFLIQWFGKDFASEQEARDFDFSKLLNRVCMINVAHKPKTDGGTKAVIVDVYAPTIQDAQGNEVPLPKEQIPPRVNPLVCYEVDNGEDAEFAKLPDFLKKKIRESDEFTNAHKMAQEESDEIDGPAAAQNRDAGGQREQNQPIDDEESEEDLPFN